MKHGTLQLLEYSVYTDSISQIQYKKPQLITTINQYSYCIAEKDQEFKEALQHSEILLPDGEGIVMAGRFLKGKKIRKIAGADIHQYLLEKLAQQAGSCMYLGASENTLSKIKNRVANEFPSITVATYSPPFKSQFSKEDIDTMIAAVNAVKPDVLFVGMTAPKQEKWAYQYKASLQTKTICAIGAVFDFYAGTVTRPSKFWIDLKLEWFVRLVKEPRRMWRRYLYYGPFFLYMLFKSITKKQ